MDILSDEEGEGDKSTSACLGISLMLTEEQRPPRHGCWDDIGPSSDFF